jgi:hypothetical protein
MDLTMMERVGDRWEKNGRILFDRPKPTVAVVPVEEEEEEVNVYVNWSNGGYKFFIKTLVISQITKLVPG